VALKLCTILDDGKVKKSAKVKETMNTEKIEKGVMLACLIFKSLAIRSVDGTLLMSHPTNGHDPESVPSTCRPFSKKSYT
jgi:hypothetical protein